jgi:hypothetical protein
MESFMGDASGAELRVGGVAAYASSAYFAHSLIDCDLDRAWTLLLDYQAWNPGLAAAEVTTIVGGSSRSEGEVVLIEPRDAEGRPLQAIYAETVKVIAQRRITWFVHPKDDDVFYNFLDFCLTPTATGVRFDIGWYSRDRLSGEALLAQKRATQEGAESLALAFKSYCDLDR